jgi:hypothetical protein
MRTQFWLESLKGSGHSEDLYPRWEDNIKMDLREIGLEGEDWINLAQDMDLWRDLVNPRVP